MSARSFTPARWWPVSMWPELAAMVFMALVGLGFLALGLLGQLVLATALLMAAVCLVIPVYAVVSLWAHWPTAYHLDDSQLVVDRRWRFSQRFSLHGRAERVVDPRPFRQHRMPMAFGSSFVASAFDRSGTAHGFGSFERWYPLYTDDRKLIMVAAQGAAVLVSPHDVDAFLEAVRAGRTTG